MYQIFRKTKAPAERSSAMEAETIQKNAASLKSQRSRGNIMQRTFLFFAVFFVSVASMFAQDVITSKNVEDIQLLVQEIGDVDVVATNQPNVQSQRRTQLEPLSLKGNLFGWTIYDSYGVKLSKNAVRNIMVNVPEALDIYNGAQRQLLRGLIIREIGGGCLIMALIAMIKDEAILMPWPLWTGVGAGFGFWGISVMDGGHRNIKKAVDVYNERIERRSTSDLSLNFGITRSGGIGLTLNF